MALSLDDVQNVKFRMTERTGYKTVDVDEFVDEVEASFEELYGENANLSRQLSALKSGDPDEASSNDDRTAVGLQAPADEQAARNGHSREILTVTTSSEASAAVTRLVQMSTEHAESVVAEAEAEAARIGAEADQSAKQLTVDATARAERVENEAQANAERVRTQAQDTADQLDQETQQRRREMLAGLERERGQLADSIAELRQHENDFRQALTNELSGYIDALSGSAAEPSPAPELPAAAPIDRDGRPGQDADTEPDASASANASETGLQNSDETGEVADPAGDPAAGNDDSEATAVEAADTAGAAENGPAARSKTPRLDALLHGKS
jgi:DivIVA domain-containing protein